MGWANCGEDSKGRPIGYAHQGTCDHPGGCTVEIDRGIAHACGGMHGTDEASCEGYFCSAHQETVTYDGKAVSLCLACAAARHAAEQTSAPAVAAGAPQIPGYLNALAGLYRQLGGHWLRGPERQRWREKMARELEQMARIFEQPVAYTAVHPHVKDLDWGDGPASCVRVESATVVPADVALAFLRCSRFEPLGCPDRAAACAELVVMTMGLHQNPEAPLLMECSPYCGELAGALAAWGTIAEELAAMAKDWTVTWGPSANVYRREVLMLMGAAHPAPPAGEAMAGSPGQAAGANAPRWQQELERLRLKALADNGNEMPIAEHQLMAQLFDLQNLADCIKSGSGKAVVPDGVAELLDVQPVAGWIVARVVEGVAVLTRVASHDKTRRAADAVREKCDAYGNGICETPRVRGS